MIILNKLHKRINNYCMDLVGMCQDEGVNEFHKK